MFLSNAEAQVTWAPVDFPSLRRGHAAVYDEGRQRLVVFGGTVDLFRNTTIRRTDTAEWDGTRWLAWPESASLPVSSYWTRSAYDPNRGVLMALGYPAAFQSPWFAESAAPGQWVLRPVGNWPWFQEVLLDFDRTRGRAVMVGGPGTTGAETWEWDGATWLHVGPFPGYLSLDSAMAYDVVRQRTVLWCPGATYEWNGSTWSVPVAGGPSGRYFASLAWAPARQRLLLSGGQDPSGQTNFADAWEWTGSSWVAAPPLPSARSGHAVVGDPTSGRLFLVGGDGGGATLGDLHEATATGWQLVDRPIRPERIWYGVAHDPVRQRTVLFGGKENLQLADAATWSFDGERWQRQLLSPSPSPRIFPTMTFDPARQRMVLFGGYDGNWVPLHDTWEWDGSSWAALQTATIPDPGHYHALAYDSVRQRLVLTGITSTYEFDGTDWQWRGPGAPGQPLVQTVVFDPQSARTLRFNASSATTLAVQAWDGVQWTLQPASGGPLGVSGPPNLSIGYDEVRQRTVLTEPRDVFTNDSWEWDGQRWLSACHNPYELHRSWAPPLVWVPSSGTLQLHGDWDFPATLWVYRSEHPAQSTPFGTGCGMFQPSLRISGLPWLGDTLQTSIEPRQSLAFGLLMTGFTRTSWSGGSLPLDLTSYGFPGCSLLTSPDVVMAMAGGTLPVALPNSIAFTGLAAFQQGLAVDALGQFGLTTGLALRLGNR